jgi:nicotinamide riboside kinase
MEEKKTTTIISLYGGPGAGKSTSAAYMYYLLKAAGENTELVREYVKDWAWEGRKIDTYDQIYFLGKQIHKESMLFSKVKYLVTDSPIFMNYYYASLYCTRRLAEGVKAAVLAFYEQTLEEGHKHHHILLHRTKPYVRDGRYQTEDEALAIDDGVERMLRLLKIPGVVHCNSSEEDLKNVWEKIIKPGVPASPTALDMRTISV